MQRSRDRQLAAKLARIDRALEAHFGPVDMGPPDPPLDELILTILSQNTTGRNSQRAFASLRQAFATWEAVMYAPQDAVAEAIHCGGLAQTKSGRIQRILRSIAEQGPLNLDYLQAMSDEEAEEALLAFDGIGRKSARCVLMFSLGRDVFPIDTHIYRILTRVGVVPPSMSAERAHRWIPPCIPEGRALPLHVHLIWLGRRLCHPRNPECVACPIRRECPYSRAASQASRRKP